jgi:DNA integrity scanning protein DisA with diadenylate cyclase activity
VKITQLEPLPAIYKFKNKEDFCNRLIQEVITISKNNSLYSKKNKKIIELEKYRDVLNTKNERLNNLLEKSINMKEDLTSKISLLVEDNNVVRNKLLELLHP